MFQQHACESDEDVLKPVNEYNILDKIKEANKELFGDQQASGEEATATTTADGMDLSNCAAEQLIGNSSRKVKFALNLEDYEGATGKADEQVLLEEANDAATCDRRIPVINESLEDEDSTTLEVAEQLHLEQWEISGDNNNPDANADEEIEEICEEIIVIDMDSGQKLEKDTEEINRRNIDVLTSETSRKLQLPLATTINEIRSGSNGEEKEESTTEVAKETDDNDDDDEDDKYSIIVASYLPDDKDVYDLIIPKKPAMKNIPFTKRFSFRRKSGPPLSSTTAATTTKCCHFTNNNSCIATPPDAISNLKFNYKTCCEYRNAITEKLPKYTGYLSEYGLSQVQWEKREQKLQKHQRFVLEKALKANEHEVRQMQDNERAFTTWLRNKMRFPINKTRNMFDVKLNSRSSSATRNRSGASNSGKKIK